MRREELKRLSELRNRYEGDHVSDVLNFVRSSNIRLPVQEEYLLRSVGTSLHIYGENGPITRYESPDTKGVKSAPRGFILPGKGPIKHVILHSQLYIPKNTSPKKLSPSSPIDDRGESRRSGGESKSPQITRRSGESKRVGES